MFLIGLILLNGILVCGSQGWAGPNYAAHAQGRDHWLQVRRSMQTPTEGNCEVAGGKCYSTIQCCKGFVCAEFDDYFGSANYAIPGFCVREKDLEVCSTNDDCPASTRCIFLGRTGLRYCVPVPEDVLQESPLSQTKASIMRTGVQQPKSKYPTINKGGLGDDCVNDDDCKIYTTDGESKLCCQKVKRGRLGWKKMCDRVSLVSKCIIRRK